MRFQMPFHDTSTAARSKSQSRTPDLCLSVNFKLNFVTLSFPCGYHFLGVSQLFRPAPCPRRVQQAGLYNLLLSLARPSFKIARVSVEVHVCPHC